MTYESIGKYLHFHKIAGIFIAKKVQYRSFPEYNLNALIFVLCPNKTQLRAVS